MWEQTAKVVQRMWKQTAKVVQKMCFRFYFLLTINKKQTILKTREKPVC